MKNILILAFFLFISSFVSFAQKEIKPTHAALSSGQGPLSSGLFFESSFSYGDDVINVSLGERDMYIIYLKKIGKIHAGPSFEYYYNVPTLGIMGVVPIVAAKDLSISAMTWTGISAGDPGMKAELLNWQFLFFWQSVDLSYKRFSLTSAILWFDDWGHLFDIKYTQPLTKRISTFASGGYSFYQDGQYLFKIGLTIDLKGIKL